MAQGSVTTSSRRPLKEKATDEFKKFMVIFLYLWVVFAALSVHRSLILSQHHLDYEEHTLAIINAFIFAKVLLVGENLHFGERFKDKALLFPILHKSFIFTVVVIGFHLLETSLVALWRGKSVTNSLAETGMGNVLGVLSWGMMSFIVLLPFFGFREIGRVIGQKELWNLIFKQRAPAFVGSGHMPPVVTEHTPAPCPK